MQNRIIQKRVEAISKLYPINIALNDGHRNMTYRELDVSANRIAQALRQFGVVPERVVGLYLEPAIEYLPAMLGVLKAGGIFLPLNTRFPVRRIAAVISKTAPAIYITHARYEDEFISAHGQDVMPEHHILILEGPQSFRVRTFSESRSLATDADFSSEAPVCGVHPDSGCYIMTTSGSTGEPKAILGSHKGLCHFIDWEISEFGFDRHARTSLLAHITFDASLRDIFVPLTTGGTLYIPDNETKQNPKRLIQWMDSNEVNIVHTVPTVFRLLTDGLKLAQREGAVVNSIKTIMLAGEPLYWDDIKRWEELYTGDCEMVNFYGPSETTLIKVFYRIAENHHEQTGMVPLGRPLPETEIMVLKADTRCAPSELGEIYIKTDYMTKGYYNDSERTEQSFIKNPITGSENDIVCKTGDFGFLSADGNLYYGGRQDNQIKLNGIRIEIGEIEVALRRHPDIVNAAVVADNVRHHRQELVCFVHQKTGTRLNAMIIKGYLSSNLPDYMVPNTYVFTDRIPLLPNGKVDRKTLLALKPPGEQTSFNSNVGTNNVEYFITEIWKKLLNRAEIDREQNFFDLGGDSFKVMRLVAMIDELLKIDVPAVKLFEYPTIKLLAQYIGKTEPVYQNRVSHRERAQKRRNVIYKRRLKAV